MVSKFPTCFGSSLSLEMPKALEFQECSQSRLWTVPHALFSPGLISSKRQVAPKWFLGFVQMCLTNRLGRARSGVSL